MVNNLEIKKVHVVLLGVVAMLLAALTAMAAVAAPAFDLVRYIGLNYDLAVRIIYLIDAGYGFWAIVSMAGMGIASLVVQIGLYFIRTYIRRYGVRAAAWM